VSRLETGVTRGPRITILVDGRAIETFAGETVATAMLMSGRGEFGRDDGRRQGLFCNMGTCFACTVSIQRQGWTRRRVRACLTPVEPGMAVMTWLTTDD
jgi:sarcosine oxidase subunit alpha